MRDPAATRRVYVPGGIPLSGTCAPWTMAVPASPCRAALFRSSALRQATLPSGATSVVTTSTVCGARSPS